MHIVVVDDLHWLATSMTDVSPATVIVSSTTE